MRALIAIDIGNTDTVVGISRGKRLGAQVRFPSAKARNTAFARRTLRRFLQQNGAGAESVRGVVISSVVPQITSVFVRESKRLFNFSPLLINGSLDIGMPIRYQIPKKLGPDRICNAVAAYTKYGGPCIVIDLGTATTFDVVSRKGEFLGGAIAAGIATATNALFLKTSLLPGVKLAFPTKVIGTNTVTNIQSGVLFGALDALDGMVRRIKKKIGQNATVIATGGFSHLLARRSKTIDHIEPTLVLEGARLIYERLQRGRRR